MSKKYGHTNYQTVYAGFVSASLTSDVRMALTPRKRIVLLLLTLAGSLCTQSSGSFRIQVCPQDVVGGVGVAIPGDVAVLAHSHPPDCSPRPPVLGLKQLRVTPAAQLAAAELVHQVQPHPGCVRSAFTSAFTGPHRWPVARPGVLPQLPNASSVMPGLAASSPTSFAMPLLFCNVPAQAQPLGASAAIVLQ